MGRKAKKYKIIKLWSSHDPEFMSFESKDRQFTLFIFWNSKLFILTLNKAVKKECKWSINEPPIQMLCSVIFNSAVFQ